MIVLRRKRQPRREPPVVKVEELPAERGWRDLHAEVVGEFRRLGVNPTDSDTTAVRGERRVC